MSKSCQSGEAEIETRRALGAASKCGLRVASEAIAAGRATAGIGGGRTSRSLLRREV